MVPLSIPKLEAIPEPTPLPENLYLEIVRGYSKKFLNGTKIKRGGSIPNFYIFCFLKKHNNYTIVKNFKNMIIPPLFALVIINSF